MSRSACTATLALLLLTAPAVQAAVAPRQTRVGEKGEAVGARQAPVGKADHSWMLRPKTFSRLSAGGRRLALSFNGLSPTRRPPPPAGRTAAVEAPALAGPPVPRQNVRINNPAMDEIGHTNSESCIAVRSGRIVVGFNDAAANVAGYAVSADGGATFNHQRLPGPPDGFTYGDPVVAFGPAGEVYYSTLMSTGGDTISTVGVAKSTDGGVSFGAPVDAAAAVENDFDSQDKDWLAVDSNSASKYAGYVYLSWTYFASTGETSIFFARSRDGGQTFDEPVLLSPIDTYGVQNSVIGVGPGGEVYVAFEDGHISPDGISIVKSTDGGASFFGPVSVVAFNGLSILTGGGGVRASSYPSLAVDGSGHVHLVLAAPKSTATTDRADVVYLRSVDGGSTWSAPVMLNDDGTSTTQAFPWVASAADGSVAVKWADRRNDAPNDGLTDVYMTISRDGGTTWGKNFRITDTNWVYGPVERDFAAGYHGDYDTLAADGGNYYVTWSDERGADPDVYFAWLPTTFDAGTPDADISAVQTYGAVRAGQAASFDLATSATNGFSSSLTLSASTAVPGLATSFSEAAVSPGDAARLTLTASPQTVPGDYHITVTADGGGLTRKTTLWLTVYDAARLVPTPVDVSGTAGFTGTGGAKADGAGRLHLLYEDDTDAVLGEDVFYRRSLDGGATWSAPLKLNAAGSFGIDTVLAADASGRVAAVWTGETSADSTMRVFVARSTDGGATFSAPVAVTPASQDAAYPTVAIDGSGDILIAYFEDSSASTYVYTTRASGTGPFDTPLSVGESSAATITRSGLAFDPKGAAYLTYTQQTLNTGGNLLSTVRLAVARDGRNFSAPVDLTKASDANAFGPDVTVAPDSSVVLAYYAWLVTVSGDVNREVMAIRSTDGGATFSPPVNVSNDSGQSFFPSVAVEPGGAIDIVWEDDTGNLETDVFLSRSTDGGKSFSAPLNLSGNLGLSGSAANPLESLGSSGRAAASVGASGVLWVSWLDDSSANPDVFLLGADPTHLVNLPPTAAIISPVPGTSVEAGVPVVFSGTGSDPEGGALTFTWDFGDGTTGTGAAPPPHPFAAPGAYTVTLTVEDALGLAAQASVSVTVATPSLSGASLLLPVVVDSPGAGGSHYVSDVTLVSRAAAPSGVLLAYTASKGSGSGFARLTLAAGEMRILSDVIAFLRGQGLAIPADGTEQAGTLLVTFGGVSDPSVVFAGARTFTHDPSGGSGTFGLFYAAAEATDGPATLFGLQQNGAERSNLALVNAGGDPVTLRAALEGPNGEDLGALPDQTLPPWGWVQLDQPLSGKASSGRAVITRVSGTSPFTAYAVLNDAVTSDGSFLPPILGDDGSGADRLVPVVVDVPGIGGRFRTELTLTNFTSATLPLTLVYTAETGFGSGSGSATLTLNPLEQRIVPDAIALLRGSLPIESDGRKVGGSLLVQAPGGTPAAALAVGARTFIPGASGGTYGLFYPGLTLAESAEGPVFVYGLQEDDAQRSNLAVVNRGDAGDAVTLRITYFGADGAALGSPAVVTLTPGQWLQFGRPLSGYGATAGYAEIERISGSSLFAAYGVLNDNVSSDGSYIAMSR